MGKVFTTDELYAIMRGEQQNQQTPQDARAAMNDRVTERNAQRRAEQLAGVQAKTAGYTNGTNPTTAGSVNEGAGEEKPKSAGIDLSPKQNVTGNALYDQWREAMTGRLGKDFEARMNAAEAAADPKKLQDAYRTASDEYDKAKKAESAAWERMKNAPTDAVAEKHRPDYESAKAAREAAEAEFDRSKAQLESAGVELPDTSTWGKIKHLFAGTSLERLGSDVGAMRGLYEAGQKGRTAQYQQAYDELQPQIARAQTAYDEMRKLYGEAGATAEYNALKDLQQKSDAYKKVLDENIQQRATAATSEMANSLTETGGAKLEEAKQGLSPIGRLGVDAASAGLNMLYDAALGRFGGLALTNAAMGLRSFGQTAQAAEASGADIDRQIGAGAAAAAKTVITNGLVDGLAGLYGKGAADDIIEMAVGKLGKTDAGRNALRVLAKSAGEGVEELVDAKLDPLVSLIYDNGEALKQKYGSGWQGYKEAAADDLYSALIGFTLGAAGQGVSAARGDYARANAELTGGAKPDANATAEAAPIQQATPAEVQNAAPTQQAAPAETQAATPIQETSEATQSAQETEQHPRNPQDTDTREARPSILERARTARAQRKAAEAQAIEEHSAAQIQYYEEHGWEATLPKELETKNMGKWVKARTAAILEENAASASREAKATPAAEAQAAIEKTGADYLAEAAGLSKGTEAPQTRAEAQGDNPAPARAQEAKQAGSDALNSALNLNNVETQTEGTIEERRAALDQRLARLMEQIEAEGENPAAQDALTAEAEAIDAEDRAIKAAEEQSRRVEAGEVSKAFGSPENHIDNRSFSGAANKGTKAFQFDYPELHGYFVEAAQSLLADVQAAQDADYLQRYKKGGADYHGPISRLVDSGMTKPRIMQCLNDIISNNGAENYADAKRVEIVLNDMLSNGWLDMSRRSHGANAEYVAAKDGITGAVKADSWEKYRAAHALSLDTGLATEAQLRAEWEATQTKTQQPAQAQKNTAPTWEAENSAMSDADLQDYLSVGERQHVRSAKAAQLDAGSSPILTTVGQIRNFIRSAMYGEQANTIKAYGKVGSKMAQDISAASGGKTNVSGYYLELDGNRIRHMKDHVDSDTDGRNIPLTSAQAEQLTDYIDHYDSVLDVLTRKDGSTKVYLSKATDDGHVVVVELVSKGRKSLQPTTAWQNTNEAFENIWGKKRADYASQVKQTSDPRGYQPALTETTLNPNAPQTKGGVAGAAPAEAPASTTSIPTTAQNVKSENQENAEGVFEPVYNRDAKPYTEEKLSRFWTNTLNETESAAGAPGEVSQPLSYMPKTEKQSLGEAASRLSADRQGEIERLVSAEAWSGVQVDAAASVAADLYREAKTTGNYEAYTAWRKVMQEHITSGGQGVQALAKYSRHSGENALSSVAEAIANSDLTPEQRTTLINKVGYYAQRFDMITRGMPDSDVNAAGNKIRKAPTKELVSLIEDMAHERGTWTFKDNVYSDLLGKQSDAYLKEYAYRQLLAMGNDSLAKATAADKAKAVQSMMQLTSVATFARNIGGNVTFGAVDTMTQDGLGVALDFALSKVTGKRTVGFDKGWLSSEARRGAADAMQKSILEVAGDVDMEGDTNRYGQTSGRAFKMDSSPTDRFFSRWQQIMGYSLTTSDKFSRGAIEAEQMRGLGAIKDSGLTNEEMQALAKAMADYRLFQNQGTAYGISKAAHDYANAIGFGGEVEQGRRTGGFGLGDFVNTYPGVPANLGVKVLEYSPANVIKGGIEMVDVMIKAKQGKLDVAKQQQAVMDVARGLAGVPAFALFAALTKAGFIRNWDDEDDADVRQQNAAEGKTGIQFNLDGTLRYLNGDKSLEWREGDRLDSIGWLEPINGFMAVGSLMANEPEGSSKWVYVGDIATGAIQSFLDIPVMSNVSDIVDTFQYSKADTVLGKAGEAAAKYAGNMATSFTPSPVRGVAKGIDPYYRDTTGDTATETAWNQFKLAVPGLRQTLPVKLDNFGQQKMYSGNMAERLLDTLVNPGTRTTIRQSDAGRVVEQLYKATGDAGVYPDRKAPNSIKAGDETYTLSAEEKREYQALSGSISSELIASLEANGLYKAADGGKKADIVKDINSYAEEQAKIQWAQSRGQTLDAGETKYEELAEAGVTDIPDYFAAYIGLNNAKNGGKKADYSYVDKVIDKFSKLSQGAQDVLTDKGLNVKKLLYADSKGIDSKDWYTVHEAAKEHEKETGRESAWVTAEAIGKTVKGDDAEKLKALEAEFPPNDDSGKNEKLHGKRSAVVRRYNAAINAGMSWDDWTAVEKTISDADASWGATSGKYSGEYYVTKALRNAGYSKSQAAHIWSIYEKTDKETGNFAVYDYFFTDKGEEEAEEKTASGVPRNRDAAADWVMKHSRAAKRRIS